MAITKPYHSPHQVTYDDLVQASEERLKQLTWARNSGRSSGWHSQHNQAVEAKLLQLLKKFKKDPQLDLFEAFGKLK